ncbi:MAG: hypothetical protein PHO26_00245 [Dehalococcoidia bacterium]|nr:hypothetical protein [Dehalococcoidia bacterium]MDD5494179.1 hypothetical protein [Dehalococcoidia bacterium]
MLLASKVLLVIAGLLLILDAVLMVAHIPNPLFGWPLPCPLTLVVLGLGIILFVFGSKAFNK